MLRFMLLYLWLTISPTVEDFVPMHVERLPDLNIPRSAHALVAPDGELTVIGGHTTGFLLTPTAEYYKDGKWNLVETLYPHDFGSVAMLPTGEVIVAGGCDEPFGIGRSFGVECYDKTTHRFSALPILDVRRTRHSMALQSDGALLVSGNWHGSDGVGSYSQEKGGLVFQQVSQERANPFILQVAPDNAFIFSDNDNGTDRDFLGKILVDQLQGDAFEEPLLQEWKPLSRESSFFMSDYFIGNEAVGGYAWLIPVVRKEDGQAGILKLVGETFSLLETEQPVPMQDPDGCSIRWDRLYVDRMTENVWLQGNVLPSRRICICKVGYGEALRGSQAPLTLYYADLWEDAPKSPIYVVSTLLPGGRIAIAGGYAGDNYHPVADAFILHTEPLPQKHAALWWMLAVLALLCIAAVLLYLRRKRANLPAPGEHLTEIDQRIAQVSTLMTRIKTLMEEKELFKKTDLKVEDIAEELGTNTAYVRQCIAGAYGGSFKNFVNEYRVRYVQQALKKNPEAKITALALDAGFSSSATFYRNFTAVTGLSPAAWLKQEQERESVQ